MSQCSVHDNYFAKLQSLWTTVCCIRCQLRKSFHILAVLHSQKLKTESWKQRCRIDKCIHSLLLKCFMYLLNKGQSELMSRSEQQMSLSWRRRRFDNVMVVINEEGSCSFCARCTFFLLSMACCSQSSSMVRVFLWRRRASVVRGTAWAEQNCLQPKKLTIESCSVKKIKIKIII